MGGKESREESREESRKGIRTWKDARIWSDLEGRPRGECEAGTGLSTTRTTCAIHRRGGLRADYIKHLSYCVKALSCGGGREKQAAGQQAKQGCNLPRSASALRLLANTKNRKEINGRPAGKRRPAGRRNRGATRRDLPPPRDVELPAAPRPVEGAGGGVTRSMRALRPLQHSAAQRADSSRQRGIGKQAWHVGTAGEGSG